WPKFSQRVTPGFLRRYDFPQAEMLCEQILSLPMYPGIKSEDIAWVLSQISLI
ncbi:DegT/DnrJ/EryC1/StrS family aminotransferase, partial [Crocosphaera sp. Alani8]|uniref:DegT/DnrJ/EryC1/StrS family aminotransferase n=1 Tax=Crocosphaera sp. Alani8 TaxID=3038952 RepID=UPI00406BF16B